MNQPDHSRKMKYQSDKPITRCKICHSFQGNNFKIRFLYDSVALPSLLLRPREFTIITMGKTGMVTVITFGPISCPCNWPQCRTVENWKIWFKMAADHHNLPRFCRKWLEKEIFNQIHTTILVLWSSNKVNKIFPAPSNPHLCARKLTSYNSLIPKSSIKSKRKFIVNRKINTIQVCLIQLSKVCISITDFL